MKDVAASVRQRLLNRARETGRPFDELLVYYGMERFLYRLSISEHRDRFVLKGALMLTAWDLHPIRTTRDIDVLGHMENDIESVAGVVRDICSQQVEDDGITFDPATVTAERIIEQGTYEGVRVTFAANLQNAVIPMRLDIGFGDPVVPAPTRMHYPAILDMPTPVLYGYTRESAVAEKFEAMVKLGEINSRMKDFYDVWLLSRQFDFDGGVFSEAIRRTFERRGTRIPANPVALRIAFGLQREKRDQWQAFIRRQKLDSAPDDFAKVTEALRRFLGPVAGALAENEAFTTTWRAPGPWR